MKNFSGNVRKLIVWYGETHEIPSYNEIMVIEQKNMRNNYSEIYYRDLVSELAYENRFQELLEKGFSWINVSLYGVWQEHLIIGIEYPYEGSNVPKEFVSINFSGPSQNFEGVSRWNLNIIK